MLKNKNRVTKISNILFITMFVLSLFSIISLITTGYVDVEGRTKKDFILNLAMMIVYFISSGLILYITNKKINLYKDEYSISRQVFNLFVVISSMSIILMISTTIISYFLTNKFSFYTLLSILFGYIPVYVYSYIIVSKTDILSKENDKKINISNLLVIFLLMNYSINFIVFIFQMIFEVNEIMVILPNMCFALIWICIVFIAYKLINRKA